MSEFETMALDDIFMPFAHTFSFAHGYSIWIETICQTIHLHYTSRFELLATHERLKYFPNSSLSTGSPPFTCILRENANNLEANVTNVQGERHIPIVTRMGDDIQVSIGSNIHPVVPDHRMEWIAMDTGEKTDIVYLKAGEEPVVEFSNISAGVVYAYCNIHGLW